MGCRGVEGDIRIRRTKTIRSVLRSTNQTRRMSTVVRLIADYNEGVRQYEAALPYASGQWQEKLMRSRDLNLRIMADLRSINGFKRTNPRR
jgi:hypothetical protein